MTTFAKPPLTYSNLEFDLETGGRGSVTSTSIACFENSLKTTQGQPPPRWSTIVVNNNAAATMLVLAALAECREVIVSRGELIEIGGSFRIPEVMAQSGATLVEVGATNRTRIADYERAITDRTRLLLRVHRSNFAITGFTEQPAFAGTRRPGPPPQPSSPGRPGQRSALRPA